MNPRFGRIRRGQSLVEFAVVALVLYMILAAILTFGHAIYAAQGLQTAADLAAKEDTHAPLPTDDSIESAASSQGNATASYVTTMVAAKHQRSYH